MSRTSAPRRGSPRARSSIISPARKPARSPRPPISRRTPTPCSTPRPIRALPDPRDRVLGYIDFRKAILQGELPQFTCLLGTMVQEAYDTHPAIRAACDRYISEHAQRLEADIAEAKALYAPEAAWTPGSAALFSQAVLQGGFVLAKAKHGPKVAADCLDHLKRYFEALLGSCSCPAPRGNASNDRSEDHALPLVRLQGRGGGRALPRDLQVGTNCLDNALWRDRSRSCRRGDDDPVRDRGAADSSRSTAARNSSSRRQSRSSSIARRRPRSTSSGTGSARAARQANAAGSPTSSGSAGRSCRA